MKVDSQIVEAAKQGDPQSFCRLYEEAAPHLYKLALYTLGNSHDAEDVVSETFMEAYKGLKQLRDNNAFRPWILKILNIRCKRKIAGYVKHKNTYNIDDFLSLPSDETEIEAGSSERISVLKALQQCDYEERTIVILSVLHGYTTKEIAQMLGHPQGTISSKLYRTLKKMRAFLEQE